MKIENAYSLDSDEVIDAEIAYDYYWAGIIKDKRNFECPAGNCTTQITCANLDKIRQDMKVDPYFKSIGEHEPGCELVAEILNKEVKTASINETQKSRAKKCEELPDIFGLSRPKSHLEKKQSVSQDKNILSLEGKKQKKATEFRTGRKQSSTHYSLRAFVSKFLRYKSQNLLAQRYINIKGYDVSYQEMFVEISGQNLEDLSKYPRVYFGKAFIDRRRESDYSATFEASLSLDGKFLRPSTYISETLINKAFTKKLSQEKFDDLSRKNYPSAWVFAYGVPKKKVVNDKQYININIANLDYFDLREGI